MPTSQSLKNLSIKYALENNWEQAYKINAQLIKDSPNDLDTLNRLAFSSMKLKKFRKAKTVYNKVIKIDKTNPIALRNLKRLDTLSKNITLENSSIPSNQNGNLQDLFIEESGKTKTVDLKNVADRQTLSQVQPGDMVVLTIKRSKVFAQNLNKKFLGMLPDNIGMRMVKFIKGGNEYQACVKYVDEKSITIFIKEVKCSPKFKNQPSFLSSSSQ